MIVLQTRYARENEPSTVVAAKSPTVTTIASPPGFARSLATKPEIWFLDEPFSALDSQTRLALADEVTDILRREAKTVILVTHDIGEAISMAERVIVLSRRPGQLKSDHAIRFAAADGMRLPPFAARNAPEFNKYFNTLWQELEVHVEG